MQPLHIDIAHHENAPKITLLTFRGDLETASIGKISESFNQILENFTSLVIAEMSGVQSISSAALGELMGGRKMLVDNGGDLYLCGLNMDIRTKLTLMGANKIFKFYNDIRNAVNSYKWEFEGKPEAIRLSFPPDLKFVPAVRQLASKITWQKGYNRKDSFRIETIVDEICNNSIEHGIKDTDDNVDLAIVIDNKKVEIKVKSVSDPDKISSLQDFIENKPNIPKPDRDQTRGRGLSLIKLLSNTLDIDCSENGTSVRAIKFKEE